MARKRGGLGEPIPKNVSPLTNGDLRPMGLLIPDQDFGDFVGCQGAFFKRDLAGKVGHFVSSPFHCILELSLSPTLDDQTL